MAVANIIYFQDGVWEQQIASAEFTTEEWQWVQEPGAEGYYYNSVTVSTQHEEL